MAVSSLLQCYNSVRNQTKVNSSISLWVNTVQRFGTEQWCCLEGNGQVSPWLFRIPLRGVCVQNWTCWGCGGHIWWVMCLSGSANGPSCYFHSASPTSVSASTVPRVTASTGTVLLPWSVCIKMLLRRTPLPPSLLFCAWDLPRVCSLVWWQGLLRGCLRSPHAVAHKCF